MENFIPASGWIAVLILLVVAVFAPVLTLGITAFCLPRTPDRNPDEHWAERARRLVPFKVIRVISLSLLPVLYATITCFYPDTILPLPRWIFCSVIFLAGFASTNWIIWTLRRRYQLRTDSFWGRLRKIGAHLFLYWPIILCGIIAAALPDEWNWHCVAVLCLGLIAYFWLQFDGFLRIGRWLGLCRPADPEVSDLARQLALSWRRREPSVWLFALGSANALALLFQRAILITDKARSLFSPDEMRAVLSHELAHLDEDQITRLMRLLTPLLHIPLIKLLFVALGAPEKIFPFLLWLPVIGAGFILLGRRRRRMEIRADIYGSSLHEDKSIYARALAKLYQANETPAVMPKKGMAHPHLYDRLKAAGVTPDFPRPNPPPSWGTRVMLVIAAVNIAVLLAVESFVLDYFDRG